MGKSIRDAMTADPCAIDADKPVAYAAKMMKDEDVGLAPIVDGDKLVGAVTDRDIVTRVVAMGKDPASTPVRDVASRDIVTVGPQQGLDDALNLMAKHQVRRLPVVEEDGRLVGVVSQGDVAGHASASQTGNMVEEISEN
jgi:CBS domain-containing protein